MKKRYYSYETFILCKRVLFERNHAFSIKFTNSLKLLLNLFFFLYERKGCIDANIFVRNVQTLFWFEITL